jgi:hypothetical protein
VEVEPEVHLKERHVIPKFELGAEDDSDDDREAPPDDVGEKGARTIKWSLPDPPKFINRDPRVFVKRYYGLSDLVTKATAPFPEERAAPAKGKAKKR